MKRSRALLLVSVLGGVLAGGLLLGTTLLGTAAEPRAVAGNAGDRGAMAPARQDAAVEQPVEQPADKPALSTAKATAEAAGKLPVGTAAERETLRTQAEKAFRDGNFAEAYTAFYALALGPQDEPSRIELYLSRASGCLQQLNRVNELDAFREAVVAAHPQAWRVLRAVASNFMQQPHYGFMIAGEFERGDHRGGGKVVNAEDRDRVRALQLLNEAMSLVKSVEIDDANRGDVAGVYTAFADTLLNGRGWNDAWRLQYLTDLSQLPDYEEGWGYGGQTQGAPVDEEGNPIYYHAPKDFAAAESDGERWRWCLVQTAEVNPGLREWAQYQLAEFLASQFGVQTLADYGWFFGRPAGDDDAQAESGTWELHTLGEDETIARLATGVKRFKLPEEFNFIRLYQQLAENRDGAYARASLEQLASLFENRRQYPKAADLWRKLLKEYPNAHRNTRRNWQSHLDQIEQNWGRFEPVMSQPAGSGATVEYRFRNGVEVAFTAHEIKIEKLLDDVKTYLKSSPRDLDWEKLNIENLGYRLVEKNQRKYLGAQVAQWTMKLDPRKDHFDRRVTVATPLTKAGAYLVRAQMKDGNTNFIVLWLNDTAIVRKPLDGSQMLYYLADAVSGQPVAKAHLDFFGYRQQWVERPPQHFVQTKQFAESTDAAGLAKISEQRAPQDYQWLVTARTDAGRLAYLGFSGVWYNSLYDAQYRATKVFTITDRPVYRPAQKVHYKFWIEHAQYDMGDVSNFANQTFTVKIQNPKGEEIVSKPMKTDAFGGIEGDYDLPADAPLGVYSLFVENQGGGSFRVEEYKKPEYEVTVDAPKEPVMLGERIEATISARYYFGSPVTEAKVKYKVIRTEHAQPWFPPARWDWFYGPGYWWFGYDYLWYPGWQRWGCWRPMPFWWPRGPQQPPELVAEREVPIGPDGTVKVEIDTALAKAIHGDQDHSYQITAEVVDQSRRTIVGSGSVLVARRPFSVFAWVDRGYYRVGDTIHASFAARTLAGQPVEGHGTLKLLKITYENGKPVETPVQTWPLDTNAEGRAEQQMTASQAGQYRFSYALTDAKGHTIEGGYLFTVIGEGFDGAQYRFNALELVPDKREYSPGERVQLQINTDRAGATVLLFLRPSNGVYLPPIVVPMQGKSMVQEIKVEQKDMPNFFVEAVTVHDGRVFVESKEIVVPPEKRVLAVDVEPSAASYKPGEKAKVRLKLTTLEGQPFQGSTVVAIYDRSVEYISGGSNVADIREFFWKWRRSHNPSTEDNLARWTSNDAPPGKTPMGDIGLFGATVADELDEMKDRDSGRRLEEGFMAGNGLGGGMPRRGLAKSMAAPAAEPMFAATDEMTVGLSQSGPQGFSADLDIPSAGKPAPAGSDAPLVEPTVRKNFADTALWVGALTTDADGTAEVGLEMPENLTTWRIKVWAMGLGTRVGEGATDVVTRKDLILRMQTPRFFVQTDEVTLSANVHNYLKSAKQVQAALELDGRVLAPLDDAQRQVEVPAGGEARIDWRVRVLDEGQAIIRMKALTDEDSDAMQMEIPAFLHGMLKTESFSGVIRGDEKDESDSFRFTVPDKRQPDQTRVEVRYSPTLAGAMVDALPYLVDYPYGCTEQTLNRFVPTVITQKVLLELGLDLKAIRDKQTNLNAQEIGKTAERAAQWQRYKRNPVFDEDEVRSMVQDGVERLTAMQNSDGGWGWFSGWGEQSWPHTTAVVVHGLQMAKANDVALPSGVLERGVAWLRRYQDEQVALIERAATKPEDKPWKQYADNLDALVYMVLCDADLPNAKMGEFLFRDRTQLAVYSLATIGLAYERQHMQDKLDMILQNLRQYVVEDDENQTAWLNLPGGSWWCWYGSEYEAQAYYLKLLARTDPKGRLASRLVKYLLNNRKHATYWNSTRDTALCVEAMAEFVRRSGEMKPEMTVEIRYDGELRQSVEITPKNLFQFNGTLLLAGDAVGAGAHKIELTRRGQGPLYFNAYVTNFTLEDFITKAGLEIKVERNYFKLTPREKTVKVAGSRGQAVDQRVEAYDRTPIENLGTLQSGDLCEVELVIESKNDYEYIVFEDMKPAGFEPVEVRSGYNGNELGAYVEYRDNRVALFTRTLARGRHGVSYRMRAEIPGQFSALPTRAWAMYAPELRANSDELKLRVND